MTGKVPKSKTLKHIDSEKGTWTKKETDDGRGCGAVRPRTLGLCHLSNLLRWAGCFSLSSPPLIDRDSSDFISSVFLGFFHGSRREWLNGFSVLFVKFDSSHELGVVPMGTPARGIRVKHITDTHLSLYWKPLENTLFHISMVQTCEPRSKEGRPLVFGCILIPSKDHGTSSDQKQTHTQTNKQTCYFADKLGQGHIPETVCNVTCC